MHSLQNLICLFDFTDSESSHFNQTIQENPIYKGCACTHRQYYETVPCPLKAIYFPLTNMLHKKVPFYQEHYVGGITK